MNKLIKLLIIIISTKSFIAMGAGPSTGGGAYSVECPKNPIEPAQSVLLDLYEGVYVLNFKMKETSGSIEDDYIASVNRTYDLQGYTLNRPKRDEVLKHLKVFFRSIKFVNTVADLPVANDIGFSPRVPSQCHIAQVAYFDDNQSTIYILKSIWDRMDPLSQAALAQHELHYHFKRQLGETTSSLTRRTVAHIFSAEGPLPAKEGLVEKSLVYDINLYKNRMSTVSIFNMIPGHVVDSPVVRLQFTHIHGYGLVAKTWADLPMPHWELKYEYSKQDSSRYCIVTTPNTNLIISAPLQGTLYPNGYQVRAEYITGLPVKIGILKPDGSVLTEGTISAGKSCQL